MTDSPVKMNLFFEGIVTSHITKVNFSISSYYNDIP